MIDRTSAIAEIEARRRDDTAKLLAYVGAWTVAIAAAFLVFSQSTGMMATIGIGGLIFVASASIGGVVGFLFSVPRILAKDTPQTIVATGEKASEIREKLQKERLLSTNSNLERISEWLTTMLVGVGLTQIGRIGERLIAFSDFLKTHGGADNGLPVVGPFLLIFGLVAGFIFFYLYTRLYLSPLFQYVESFLNDGGELGRRKIEDGGDEVRAAAASLDNDSESPSIKTVSSEGTPSITETLNVMRSLLYVEGRYQKVIDLGNRIARTSAAADAEYWLLMAAAFGQKHHALLASENIDDAKLLSITRSNVLDCSRQAVSRDPRYKKLLLAMSNPQAVDNDLGDFQKDETFLSIVK